MIVQPDPELPQIVDALTPPCRFARRLDRRQQKRNQNPDDRDYDKQLDKSKPVVEFLRNSRFALHGHTSPARQPKRPFKPKFGHPVLRHNATYRECAPKIRKDYTAYFRLFFQHATRRTNYFEQILPAANAASRNCATTCARVSNEMTVCAWLQKSFRRGRVAT